MVNPNPINTPQPRQRIGTVDLGEGKKPLDVYPDSVWYRFWTLVHTAATFQVYGIGDVLITTEPTNPNTRFGYGTWVLFAEGKTIFGFKNEDPAFDPVLTTGGSATVTLGTGNLPAHNHGVTDPGHAHGITDPTHSHAVTDPGHSHTSLVAASTNTAGAAAGDTTAGNTSSAVTGISIGNHSTGVTVNSNTTGVTTNNTGSGTAFSILPSYIVVYMWRRTA